MAELGNDSVGIVDLAKRKLIRTIVPDAHGIAVVDRVSQKQIAKWQMPDQRATFPMSLDLFAVRYL
jgi:hypothetical protein